MCIIKNKLFVFDFEYALLTAPPTNDYWHYIIQSFIYEKKISEEEIITRLNLMGANRLDLVLYLIDIVGLYLERGEKTDIDIVKSRIKVLQGILKGDKELENKSE